MKQKQTSMQITEYKRELVSRSLVTIPRYLLSMLGTLLVKHEKMGRRIYFAAQLYLALSSRARWRSHGVIHTAVCQWYPHWHYLSSENQELRTKRGTSRSSTSTPTGTIRTILSARFDDTVILWQSRKKERESITKIFSLYFYWKHRRIAML